jgi:nicotinamidase-related amidase
MATATRSFLPTPPHFKPSAVADFRLIPYMDIAKAAREWAKTHKIAPAAKDATKVTLMPIDMQITFCFMNAELPVVDALEDCNRMASFIYTNLPVLTQISRTLDTHTIYQIFHPDFWINEQNQSPDPYTFITADDVKTGKWKVNPAVAWTVSNGNYMGLQRHALHYCEQLKAQGKDGLIIWPYHAMIGGIGHAMVPNVEEAVFFHAIARHVEMRPEIKGGNPLTENYSILGPEVTIGVGGSPIAQKNAKFIQALLDSDYVIIGGEAKDKCVAWSIDDLLKEIVSKDPALARKVYLLEDCTSPVKVPNGKGGWAVDGTQAGKDAFKRFADAGMHVVKSTTPIEQWPDFKVA